MFDVQSATSHRHLKPHRPHHAPPRPRLVDLKNSARHHQTADNPFPTRAAPPRPQHHQKNPHQQHHHPTAQPRHFPFRIDIALHMRSHKLPVRFPIEYDFNTLFDRPSSTFRLPLVVSMSCVFSTDFISPTPLAIHFV